MRRDIIHGMVVSAILHGGILGSSLLFSKEPMKPRPVDDPVSVWTPKMPEQEPDPVLSDDEEEKPRPLIEMPRMLPEPIRTPMPDDIPQPRIPIPVNPNPGNAGVISIPRGPLTGGSSVIFDVSKVDKIPEVMVQMRPEYPVSMRQQGIAGTVTVEFVVDSSGRVVGAAVVRSTDRAFEAGALKSVGGWKFKPGLKAGRPVATRMLVDVVFHLDK